MTSDERTRDERETIKERKEEGDDRAGDLMRLEITQ